MPTFSPSIGTEIIARNSGKEKNSATAVASGRYFRLVKNSTQDRMLRPERSASNQGRCTRKEIDSPDRVVLALRKTSPNRLRINSICSTAISADNHLIPASWIEKHSPPRTVIEMPKAARSLRRIWVFKAWKFQRVKAINRGTVYPFLAPAHVPSGMAGKQVYCPPVFQVRRKGQS